MVALPLSPSVGDQVIGPAGQTWQWDGVKWIARAAQPIIGVTDGSEAKAGEIGELLKGSIQFAIGNSTYITWEPPFGGIGVANGGYHPVNGWRLITLTPGDWDVWATLLTVYATDVSAVRGYGVAIGTTEWADNSGLIRECMSSVYTGGLPGLSNTSVNMPTSVWAMNVTVDTPIFGWPFVYADAYSEWKISGFARRRR